jgi:hypothetical protein
MVSQWLVWGWNFLGGFIGLSIGLFIGLVIDPVIHQVAESKRFEARTEVMRQKFIDSLEFSLTEKFGNPRGGKRGELHRAILDVRLGGFQVMARGAHYF